MQELRIRPKDFFKDYDRHNCGLITKAEVNPFIKASSVEHWQ